MKIKKFKITAVLPALVLAAMALPASAQVANTAIQTGLLEASTFGLPNVDLISFIGRLVRIFLALIILLVVLMIILSGFRWMLAGADEEKRNKARSALINSIVGMIIVFASYAIVSFIINILVNAAGTATPAI